MRDRPAALQSAEMRWRAEDHAWIADPEQVVKALAGEGFDEFRREIAKGGRERATSGGMWQGLDRRTGEVATVIWVAHATPSHSHVFIEIDGRAIEGSAWDEIDAAILDALNAEGGHLTIAQIATRVRMSEGAVQSVVSMLAGQGKVRITAVACVTPPTRDTVFGDAALDQAMMFTPPST